MDFSGKKMLVVSAHPGDLLWRCSGAIAKHVSMGGTADVVIITYGTGGEANEVMKQPGMTVEQCKAERKRDTEKAAEILGVRSIEFFDCEDYPFEATREQHRRLAKKIRQIEPDLILTHHEYDYCNPDHGSILKYVITSCEIAGGFGIEIEGTKPGAGGRTPIFCFEPHASEINGFQPNLFVDISDVIETKKAAMACFEGKKALAERYIQRALVRADNARSFGRSQCKYAEAYQAVYPIAVNGYFVY
ncbi:MAG: PIG-L deacetylase family protein [Oscillospiraceae bacterium]